MNRLSPAPEGRSRLRLGMDWFQNQLKADSGRLKHVSPKKKSKRPSVMPEHQQVNVHFAPKNSYRETMARDDFSIDEIREYYYSSDDLSRFFEKSRQIVEDMEGGTVDSRMCVRGLEKLSGKRQEVCHENRRKSVDSVMDLQEEQWQHGNDDCEEIARVSIKVSQPAVKRAVEEAKEDVKAAKKYLRDTTMPSKQKTKQNTDIKPILKGSSRKKPIGPPLSSPGRLSSKKERKAPGRTRSAPFFRGMLSSSESPSGSRKKPSKDSPNKSGSDLSRSDSARGRPKQSSPRKLPGDKLPSAPMQSQSYHQPRPPKRKDSFNDPETPLRPSSAHQHSASTSTRQIRATAANGEKRRGGVPMRSKSAHQPTYATQNGEPRRGGPPLRTASAHQPTYTTQNGEPRRGGPPLRTASAHQPTYTTQNGEPRRGGPPLRTSSAHQPTYTTQNGEPRRGGPPLRTASAHQPSSKANGDKNKGGTPMRSSSAHPPTYSTQSGEKRRGGPPMRTASEHSSRKATAVPSKSEHTRPQKHLPGQLPTQQRQAPTQRRGMPQTDGNAKPARRAPPSRTKSMPSNAVRPTINRSSPAMLAGQSKGGDPRKAGPSTPRRQVPEID